MPLLWSSVILLSWIYKNGAPMELAAKYPNSRAGALHTAALRTIRIAGTLRITDPYQQGRENSVRLPPEFQVREGLFGMIW